MKTFLLLLLVFFPLVLCDDAKKVIHYEFDPKEKDAFVKAVNDERRKHAEKIQIANMWKLEWSDELEEKTKSFPHNCNQLEHGSDYRFTPLPHDNITAEWMQVEINYMLENSATIDKTQFNRKTMLDFELILPSQKKIGCAAHPCAGMTPIYSGAKVQATFGIICLLGPESKFDDDADVKGEPGSKCEDEDGEDDDGLCVPSGSPGSFLLFNGSIIVSLILLVTMVSD